MPADLRAITREPAFALRPIAAVDDAVLDMPILWAHNSDLPDPTPWLGSGGLLLTDGAQFLPPHTTTAHEYTERLVRHGIAALGFAARILHAEVPSALVAACEQLSLPLFEISPETPFMGVIRFVSDATAKDERERLESSLLAQRRVARAALRPDGLGEILRELERGLGSWVALFDAARSRVQVPSTRGVPPELTDDVDEAVADALAGGRVTGMRLSIGGVGGVALQTLGQHGRLRGVLAVGIRDDAAFDRASMDLVDSVIALASISLEQSRTLDSARRRLRTGILELLAAGVTDVAGRTVHHLWGRLPAEPIRVACLVPPAAEGGLETNPIIPALELLSEERRGALFFAEQDGDIVAVLGDGDGERLTSLAARHRTTVGFSTPTTWAQFAEAAAQSRRAAARATEEHPVVLFEELARTGILGHLEQTHAHEVARRMLRPLETDTGLRRTLEVWLEHNGSWGPAAAELGIHRHTLRHRVDLAAARLGLDLEAFGARAELWSALQLTRADAR